MITKFVSKLSLVVCSKRFAKRQLFSRKLNVMYSIFHNYRERKRESPVLSFEESEWRALQHKEWSRYKKLRYFETVRQVSKIKAAQEEALQELMNESEELYQAAIQKDPGLLPLQFEGPKETPPIKDYSMPDGEYVDTSRKY